MSLRDDGEYRALQEQAHQLEELTRHPGWPVLVDFMETISRAAKLRVLNGKLMSVEEYKSVTGELIGIHKVLDAPSVVQGMLQGEVRQRDESGSPVT